MCKVELVTIVEFSNNETQITGGLTLKHFLLKYGSEEKGSSFYRCSSFLGFVLSKKLERLRSELLSEDKITNLLGFLTK